MSQRPLERARAAARRRSAADNSMSGSRPDRVAAWAFVLGIFLILLAATTSRGESGGADAPPPSRRRPRPAPAASAELGERTLSAGSTGPTSRTLQAILQARGLRRRSRRPGVFDAAHGGRGEALPARGRPRAPTASWARRRARSCVALMRLRRATWYGPGPVREPHGLRQAAAPGDARGRAQDAALRHAGDLLPRRPLRDRAGDRPRPVPARAWPGTSPRPRPSSSGMASTRAPALDPLIRRRRTSASAARRPYRGHGSRRCRGRQKLPDGAKVAFVVSFCKLAYPS